MITDSRANSTHRIRTSCVGTIRIALSRPRPAPKPHAARVTEEPVDRRLLDSIAMDGASTSRLGGSAARRPWRAALLYVGLTPLLSHPLRIPPRSRALSTGKQ